MSVEVTGNPSPKPAARVLVVEDDKVVQRVIAGILEKNGYRVAVAADAEQALALIPNARPDLIVSDIAMPGMTGLDLLSVLRQHPSTSDIPVVLLSGRDSNDDVAGGLTLGADDYLVKPVNAADLAARVRAKLVPRLPEVVLDVEHSGRILTEPQFIEVLRLNLEAVNQGSPECCLAVLELVEWKQVGERLGAPGLNVLRQETAVLVRSRVRPTDVVCADKRGRILILFKNVKATAYVHKRMEDFAASISSQVFEIAGERIRVTPAVGYVGVTRGVRLADLRTQVDLAVRHSAGHLDAHPIRYTPALAPPTPALTKKKFLPRIKWGRKGFRLAAQMLGGALGGLILPFLFYAGMAAVGLDITGVVYLAIVVALLGTSLLIWAEGLMAMRREDPPDEPATPYPPASAIIAAYLPNEAATIVDTVESFLRQDYPGPLQIIVAYNTPKTLPVEEVLCDMATRDPRLVPFRVDGSTSKAQNVNAALAIVTGEFTGVFDADHHPDPGSFARAWRWLSHQYDIVQGHCLIRNGDASWVARMVAVEFETIYAVAHPGRARMHGFGIFGGSNGYWKTSLLSKVRFRGSMLTEDIDSSLRALQAGYKICSDPYLISREFAPTTLKALWNQRLRWAQGWCQVSFKHIMPCLRSKTLPLGQKMGLFHLLTWREVFPWLALQILPILAFWTLWQKRTLDWWIPLFVVTTLITLSTGPGQVATTYLQADPAIRRRTGWFIFYFFISLVFYTELKNLMARVAQLKELMREKEWKVTPR